MEPDKIAELKKFIDLCKFNPSLLQDPSLAFFKSYLQSLGAQLPGETTEKNMAESGKPSDEVDDEIVESDIELDNTDVIEPDNDTPQKMGDPTIEVTEEKQDAAQLEKIKAMDAMCEGKPDRAVDHLTEAILLNPTSAIFYATRAGVYLQMKKPNAAIRDAEAALQINPDSAKGYKSRGMAKAMLGQWEGSASDLHQASKLDHDEEIASALKKVEPNAKKIEEHRRKYERLKKDKELKKAEKRRQQQEEAKERAALSALKDGQVISIRTLKQLEAKTDAAMKTSRLAILYFTATWCGPCRFIAPLYTNLASQYPKVVFLKIDIDEAREVAAAWGISSVPTFFFVKSGKQVDKLVGADKQLLERKTAEHSA